MLVVFSVGSLERQAAWLVATHAKKQGNCKQRKSKTVTAFSEVDHRQTIQWQVQSVHVLTCQLCILQCIKKKRPSTCCPAAKYPNCNKLRLQTCEKNQWAFLMWVSTLAPAINLQTWVPQQKFPFLFIIPCQIKELQTEQKRNLLERNLSQRNYSGS